MNKDLESKVKSEKTSNAKSTSQENMYIEKINDILSYLNDFYNSIMEAVNHYTTSAMNWLKERDSKDRNFEKSYNTPYGFVKSSISIR